VNKMGFFRFFTEPVYYVGAAISFVLGFLTLAYVPSASAYMFLSGLGGFTIWTAVYINSGVDVIPQAWVYVYEWFGRFRDEKSIANAGLTTRCFPGFIERLVKKVPLFQREIKLFRDEQNADGTTKPIDFEGGVSAPVKVKVYFRIYPGHKADLTDDKYGLEQVWSLGDSIRAFVYNVEDPENWLEATMDAATSKYLQQRTLDEALAEQGSNILEGLFLDPDNINPKNVGLKDLAMLNRESILQVGLEIVRVRYEDTDIPQSVIETRATENAAKVAKRAAMDTGSAMFIPIEAIIKKAQELGHSLTYEQAQDFYFKNRGLTTLEKVSSINLFGAGIEDALKSMLLGKGGTK
jgi:regulator of protease activity HflC (stomatin/prohibitin superfamily)